MGDTRVDDVAGDEGRDIIVLALLLDRAAGQLGDNGAVGRFDKAGDAVADRFVDSGDDGDVAGGALRDPERRFVARDDSAPCAHVHNQVVVGVADDRAAFQDAPRGVRLLKGAQRVERLPVRRGIYQQSFRFVVWHFVSPPLSTYPIYMSAWGGIEDGFAFGLLLGERRSPR